MASPVAARCEHAKLVVALIGGLFGTYAGARGLSGELWLVAQATIDHRMRLFGNAFGACTEGRKYTVK